MDMTINQAILLQSLPGAERNAQSGELSGRSIVTGVSFIGIAIAIGWISAQSPTDSQHPIQSPSPLVTQSPIANPVALSPVSATSVTTEVAPPITVSVRQMTGTITPAVQPVSSHRPDVKVASPVSVSPSTDKTTIAAAKPFSAKPAAVSVVTEKKTLDPCVQALQGKSTVNMSDLDVRSVLPSKLVFHVGDRACSFAPGALLGEEKVTRIDAERLRVETSRRVIQLVDQ